MVYIAQSLVELIGDRIIQILKVEAEAAAWRKYIEKIEAVVAEHRCKKKKNPYKTKQKLAHSSLPSNQESIHHQSSQSLLTFFNFSMAAFSFFSHFLADRCIVLLTMRILIISSSRDTLLPILK